MSKLFVNMFSHFLNKIVFRPGVNQQCIHLVRNFSNKTGCDNANARKPLGTKLSYKYKDKFALITGGLNGIGFEIAKALLKKGIKGITIADTDKPSWPGVRKELGCRVRYIETDVTNEAQFKEAFEDHTVSFGNLDLVINCARVKSDADYRCSIDVNTKGVVRGTLLAFDYMGSQNKGKGGVVINVTTSAGLQPNAAFPIYAGIGHFNVCFTRTTGTQFYFNQTGVRVVGICAGLTDTSALKNFKAMKGFKCLNRYSKKILRRMNAQCPANVGKAVILVLKYGQNGTIWLCENNEEAYEIDSPIPVAA